jgi:hypothetical protein
MLAVILSSDDFCVGGFFVVEVQPAATGRARARATEQMSLWGTACILAVRTTETLELIGLIPTFSIVRCRGQSAPQTRRGGSTSDQRRERLASYLMLLLSYPPPPLDMPPAGSRGSGRLELNLRVIASMSSADQPSLGRLVSTT